MNQEELQKHLKEHGVKLIVGAYGEGENCEGLVEKENIQVDGKGNYTKLVGCSYLFKGDPNGQIIADLAIPKKVVKISLDFVNTWWGKLAVALLFVLPQRLTRKTIMRFVKGYHEISAGIVRRHLYSPDKYCPAVREIDRALRVVLDEFFGELDRIYMCSLKDTGCMILEFDAAYKWPFQEFCSLIKKEDLKENPLKELKRVFTIHRHRDKVMGEKMKAMRRVIFLLRFNKFLLKFITRFLLEMDLEKVKPDEADRYFCLGRKSYDSRGMSLIERQKEKAKIDKEKGHNIPKIRYGQPGQTVPQSVMLKPAPVSTPQTKE